MNNDQIKTSSFVFGLVLGLFLVAVGTAALALTGHLSFGSGASMLGAAGVPDRYPHGYADYGYGYYVNGVAVIDANRNAILGNTASGTCMYAYSTTGTPVYGTYSQTAFTVTTTKPTTCP